MHVIEHQQGTISIADVQDGLRTVQVKPRAGTFVPARSCRTSYPVQLIEAITRLRGAAYLCDEIRRDEDPDYIEQHLVTTLFSFVRADAFRGKRLLDFGCGAGASTAILARRLPDAEIVAVELEERNLDVARLRAEHYGNRHIRFVQSLSGSELPPGLGRFDFIILSAVYEHLLPEERGRLSEQLWNLLEDGGVLFLDETPHRWFPVETHTTGLPLINYLPRSLAAEYARRASRRNLRRDDWELLLRKGLRGTTRREVLDRIRAFGGRPELLAPLPGGPRTPVDVWYEGYARRTAGRRGRAKRALAGGLKLFYAMTRIPLVPYVSMAIRKIA